MDKSERRAAAGNWWTHRKILSDTMVSDGAAVEMFQIDGPVWRFLNLLGDMIILHVLWLLCCIPVVTIGPATVAAYYVALKLVRDEGRGVWQMFFQSFRKNLRQGIILGLLFIPMGMILILDFYLCLHIVEAGSIFQLVMLALLGFLAILYLIEMMYVWAVLACFENTIKKTIINGMVIAMSNFTDTSVMLALNLILAVFAVLCFAFLPQAAVLFAIFGVPLFFVINSLRIRTIFDRLRATAVQS